MKNILRKWLGIARLEERIDLKGVEIGKLARRTEIVETEAFQDRRYWKLLYSAQRGLADYLGVEEY
jgi:hypothetical protein